MNTFRALFTVVMLVVFIGIVFWAYSRRRRRSFDEASHLPFDDDDMAKRTLEKEREQQGKESDR